MAIGALTTYSAVDNYATNVVIVALCYMVVTLPGAGAWALLGASLRKALSNPRIARPFNWAMAALLVASIATVFTD